MKPGLKIALIALSKILICVVFAWLYQHGGSDFGDKWLRRYLASAILCGAMGVYSRDWRPLLTYPLFVGGLSLGYGADILWQKILRRGMVGAALGTAGSVYNAIRKNFLLVGVHFFLLVLLYITLGVWNPMPDAHTEEMVLGFMVSFIPLMSIRRKES